VNIGKESNNLDEAEVLGVGSEDYQLFKHPDSAQKDKAEFESFLLTLNSKTSEKYGISKRQFMRMRKKVREGDQLKPATKTLNKLMKCYEKNSLTLEKR